MTPTNRASGFTLIELMIALVILGLLMSIAVPAYNDFIVRSKLTDSFTELMNKRLQMEQYYQDNRTYGNGTVGQCAFANFSDSYFAYTCASNSNTTYQWQASNLASQGLGAAGDYVYTIDQSGNRVTTKFAGNASANTCWENRTGHCYN